ncbi:MAG: rhomboid family intramembrane serine protease [Armatimonadetes bacterium]|nr:rhomboid family intramembrane serine protease [Armatimonadota bacterium]
MRCPRCEGSGVCVECSGEGSTVCPTCGGKGERTTPRGMTYTCKGCNGSGKVECSPTCSSCEGTGEITETLQKTVREKYTVRFANLTPSNKATSILLAVNVVMFILMQIPGPSEFIEVYLENWADDPARGELWRFVTPMFLHVDWWHLGLNSWYMWSYCPQIEGMYGVPKFLGLYFFAGICGNVLSWVGQTQVGGEPWAGIGSSTALFGVGAAYIGLWWRWRMVPEAFVRTWAAYLIGFMLVGFVSDAIGWGFGIDNWGHLGGFLGGLLFVVATKRPQGR